METEHGGRAEISSKALQLLSRKLTSLHVFDRPIDLDVLLQVLKNAALYLRSLNNGSLTDDTYEANFLRPLLRETIGSVFGRLFLADPQQYSDAQVHSLLAVSVYLATLGGELLYFHWNSTSGFNPALNGDMRRDLQGVLTSLSYYLFNVNCSFMQHNVYPPQPLYPGPCSFAGTFNTDMLTSALEDTDGDGLDPAQQAQHDSFQDQTIVVDLINTFGACHGLDVVLAALQAPDRCGVSGVHMFINLLSFSMPSLLPEYREEVRPAVQAVLKYIGQGFLAASDFAAFEEDGAVNGADGNNGGDDAQPAYHTLTLIMHCCCEISSFFNDGGKEECGLAAPLQRELVLRLLRSGHFTRQLAAVKELFLLHARAARWSTATNTDANTEGDGDQAVVDAISPNINSLSPSSPASLHAFLDWIREKKIVDQILHTNLHQPQYSEAAQRLLVHLARHGTVTATHITFLWDLIEDAATFEDIKVNVCTILGALTPHLPAETQKNVLQRAIDMALSESPPLLTLSLKLLESISRNDSEYTMPHDVLNTLCSIILRTEAPLEAATSAYLSDACLRYIECSAPGTETDWARLVTQKCTEALESGKGGVPAAYQLFETFTKIVPVYFPKPELEQAFFQDINANAKLFVMGMEAYSAFLKHQHAAMATATATSTCPPVFTAPPVGCISHAVAVEKYHRMLAELIMRGNYYITPQQLNTMLNWATVDAATPADSDSSWSLLILMVWERRKEIQLDAANSFLLESLCAVDPEYMTMSGWRCLTLYMAVVSNWNLDAKSIKGYDHPDTDFANFVVLRDESQWTAWRTVLLSTALHAKDPAASRASVLLSRLVAHDAQSVFQGEAYTELLQAELSTWQIELKNAVRTLCGCLPENGWHDAPPLAADVDPQTMEEAANTAKRALLYLQQLIENGQAKSLPLKFSHCASYRDSLAIIDLQLPAVGVGKQAANPLKVTISLPKNSYVGVLRAVAAEKVSTAIGRPVSPALLRVFSGGKEYIDDGVILTRVDLKPHVILAFASHPNPTWELSTLPKTTREELMVSASTSIAMPLLMGSAASDALVAGAEESPNCNIYSLALTMEQIHLPPEADEGGKAGHLLRSAAKGLLNALPTCSKALEDVQGLLLNESSRSDLLGIISSPDGTFNPILSIRKVAVMRYLIEALCVLILPANNPLETDEVISDTEMKAAALQLRLFCSDVMPTMLEVAAVVPATQVVSAAADHQLHVAMILLANSVSEDILNRKNFLLERNVTAGAADEDTGAIDVVETRSMYCIAVYTLAMMYSALGKQTRARSGGDNVSSSYLASAPPPLATGPVDALVVAHWTDDLCYKGWHLLKTCIDAVPNLATGLVSRSSPPPTAAAAEGAEAEAMVVWEKEEQDNNISNVVSSSSPHATYLSSIILTLRSHPKQPMRATVTSWIHHFVSASIEARHWTFETIITPLLLAIDSNDDQTFLISTFLSNLNVEEANVAEGVLAQLVDRFGEAVEGEDVGSVKATVESVLILIKRLDCHSIAESSGLVNKLLECCLFPELDVLASVQPGSTVSADAIFEAHPRALRAAQHSAACRDVCFELLFELMTHNRASWDAAHPLFMRLIDSGASIYPQLFRNVPLPSLRLPGALCGLCNGGATCYMNATFQQIYMQPTVRRLILSAPAVHENEQDDSVFHQVQSMFAHLTAGVAPYYEPRGFWRAFKDYEGQSVNIREHQDAYEFFTRLQDSVDEHLRSRGHPRAIHAALGGTFAQVITVAGRPELRSQRNEDFYQVSLDVRGKKGLTESLESYVAVEMMNGENQWLCEELGKKVDAEKRTLIGSLPNTLMLHLKRFEWDYETYSRWKVKDRFEFPLELDMKPYTVEGCAAAAAAAAVAEDGETARKPASASLPMHPNSYYQYELRGIVVHSGTAFAGHYYSYIKDRTGSGAWHIFDDTSVDQWDPVTLEEDCFGGKFRPEGSVQEYDRPNSAYMLVYERIEPVEEEEKIKTASVAGVVNNDEMMIPQGPGAKEGLNLYHQEAVARLNLANIAMVHLFAPELFNFFTGLGRELRLAAAGNGVKSRKIARGVGFTSPNGGVALGSAATAGAGGSGVVKNTSSIPGTGLGRMTSGHRPEESDDILAAATSLCCDYLYNVLARGPHALINDLSARKGDSFIAYLNSAFKTSKLVSSVLLEVAGEAALKREGMTLALSSPHSTIREGARLMLGNAVKVVIDGYGPLVGVEVTRALVDGLFGHLHFVKKRMIHPLTSNTAWDEVLSFLDEIFCEHECLVELAMPHLDTVLAIGRPLVDGFWSLSDDDKYDYDFGKPYLSLLALLLLRYDHTYLSSGDGTLENNDSCGGAASELTPPNPYCFANADGTPVPPLPKIVWDFFFADETFLRRLLMPGCLTSSNSGRLIQWLWYNNYARHIAITRAFMEHIDDDLWGFDEFLAAELPQIVDILTMKDILTPERYKESLLGESETDESYLADIVNTAGTSAGHQNQLREPRLGLLEMTQLKNRICRSVILIRVVALMHSAHESVFLDVIDLNGNDSGRAQEWARQAGERVEMLRNHLANNTKIATQWQELANESLDADSWYQLNDLSDQLAEIAGDYEYDDDEDDLDNAENVNAGGGGSGGGAALPHHQQQYPQPTVGLQYQGGFGPNGVFGQPGNAAATGFAFGLIQPSLLQQQQQQLLLAQQQQQAAQQQQQQHVTTERGIIGPVLPPQTANNPSAPIPASTPFASMDLGAPPLQGPAAVVTQGVGRNASATLLPNRQADISANYVGGEGNQDDEDDELVAEIELSGDEEDGEDGDGGGAE